AAVRRLRDKDIKCLSLYRVLKLGLGLVEPLVGEPAVDLELGLALAARCTAAGAAAAAALAVEVTPHAGQARDRVFQAGQLHLQPRLAGLRAHVEDVEDDLMAIDHRDAALLLPGALLRRAQLVVKDD